MMSSFKTLGLVSVALALGACGPESGASVQGASGTASPESRRASPLAKLAPTAGTATPACAADPYEIDDSGTGTTTPISVGGTGHRSICQGRSPLPGKTQARDVDYFSFTATEGQAYTVQVVDVGAGLVNDSADRGGLSVGFSKIGADGLPSGSGVPQSIAPNGDRSTTLALHAGQYLIGVATTDLQVYPDNTLDTKTVEGSDGDYTLKLTATAPAPVLKSLTVSPNPVKAGDRATATLTFTGPLLSGGSFVPVGSSSPSVAAPGGTQVAPGGVTSWTVTVDARRVNVDTTVDISAQVLGVDPTLSTKLTVRK